MAGNKEVMWQDYMQRLEKSGKSRFPDSPNTSVVQTFNPGD